MIRSFVFSQGKLVGQDLGLDFLKMVLVDEDAQIWVDLEKPTPDEAKNTLETVFNFHPLAIEDCVNVTERPKVDDYESYLFLVVHTVNFSHKRQEFESPEINLFIGKNFLVSYHDQSMAGVSATIDRVMKNPVSVARAPDRLTYTLLDFVLDQYEPALQELSVEIADIERRVMQNPNVNILGTVLKLKAEVQRLRQIITPQRNVIARIARGEFKLVRAHLLPYYRDLLDRLTRFSDMADSQHDSLTNTLLVHSNLQQMQTNQVIKVLTVLATLSLPLVIITSWYGMNFEQMPELHWRYPYLWVLAVTLISVALIYWILKRQRWM